MLKCRVGWQSREHSRKFFNEVPQVKRLFWIGMICGLLWSCDPEGRKKCEWVLEPEPDKLTQADPGFVPLCARNRRTMKQDCRLQAEPEYGRQIVGKKFRYVDMIIASPGNPRTITSVKFCE